jgi:hypothetical protein
VNITMNITRRVFWRTLAGVLVLSITWGILVALLSAGWWILAINITFLILTVPVLFRACFLYFRPRLSTWAVAFIGAGIWVLIVVLIRSLVIDTIDYLTIAVPCCECASVIKVY